ncbi:unnamed protein product [Euphydryas editha]|uniref:PiggyBac transposable element-derived protein domain-containing protein n=1 Tax=Euphydryas editha TaxID=104508 RepID=A0AAU9U0A0_EUPED|nr:unnamed protein product [Euphydryas editha]
MARNRFLLLRNALKVVFDEDVTPEEKASDRLWKVRPLITAVRKGCKLQEKTQNLSVDEMIIPFQGICGMKQYCPGKPNPVGLKTFVLATPEGLVCDFDIYQGNTTYPDFQDTNFGLSEKAVLSLTKDLVPGHIIYCDRYFTVMTDDKEMKKKPRGSWKIVVNKAKKLVLTKWVDSKPVTFLSNVHADQTIDECQRWSKTQRKYISVPRPEVVKLYNRNMGGVDMADRMLSYCPYRYRTKKWTQRVMSHCIDLAISNSWILYRQDKKNEGADPKSILQLRYFKMEIAEAIIDANIDTDSSLDEPENREEGHHENQDEQHLHFRRKCVPAPIPSAAQRYRKAGHLPEVSEVQRKCRLPGCKMKTKIICTSCKIHLCLTHERSCYKLFHVPRQ